MQEVKIRATRSPIKRPTAESNILISLTCFGLTVAVTRIFLEWAGYPQIGNDVLHIAHALWGGLLLFVAVLVTLVLANRWALTLSAVLSGVGVGLFIDEVGKFITQKNDYFFPPAAPIIYSAFLLMVLLLLLVRRSRRPSPRASLYRALLGLRELLDHDLDTQERDRILVELENGRTAREPHIALLAEQLSAYMLHDATPLTAYRPGFWARADNWLRMVGEKVGRKMHRRIIIILTAISGISALVLVSLLLWSWLSPEMAGAIMSALLVAPAETSSPGPVWLVVRLILQTLVGLLYLASWLQFIRKKEDAAVNTAMFASLLAFTAVNLLNFYLNQFGALSAFFSNLLVYFILVAYRSWYLAPRDGSE